jgi:hypothetical protein
VLKKSVVHLVGTEVPKEVYVRGQWSDRLAMKSSMTAATAATTGATAHRSPRLSCRGVSSVTIRRTKYGHLNRIFLSGALGASNFLVLVQYDALELRLALITDVFVDRHNQFRDSNQTELKSGPT